MLAIIRIILIILLSTIICIFGLIYCLFTPRNPYHVATFSHLFGRLSPILGIRVKIRYQNLSLKLPQNCIYIANHQNNYDMVTASCAVQPRTVTIGKKSLVWIPLFGWLYWITGNFFIDRNNIFNTYNILNKIIKNIKKKNISIWIFPEGTRSQGRGLLPFKIGAFYIATVAGIPIVPICISNITNKIKLNRWYNGLVIIEILSPIETKNYNLKQIKTLSTYCYDIMKTKINKLNVEVAIKESQSKH